MKKQRNNMHHGATPQIFFNAEKLRADLTEAEKILWDHLKDRKMEGIKFRRQHPSNRYVQDFFANGLKLSSEVDGDYHLQASQKFSDNDRDENLMLKGIFTIRFTNQDVFNSLEKVLEEIRKTIRFLKENKLKRKR